MPCVQFPTFQQQQNPTKSSPNASPRVHQRKFGRTKNKYSRPVFGLKTSWLCQVLCSIFPGENDDFSPAVAVFLCLPSPARLWENAGTWWWCHAAGVMWRLAASDGFIESSLAYIRNPIFHSLSLWATLVGLAGRAARWKDNTSVIQGETRCFKNAICVIYMNAILELSARLREDSVSWR